MGCKITTKEYLIPSTSILNTDEAYLLTIARKQKRQFCIIHFGSRDEIKVFDDLLEADYNKMLDIFSKGNYANGINRVVLKNVK